MRNTTLYKNAPKTFRRSSAQLITGHGGNCQNIEKSVRKIYHPDGFRPELEAKCRYYMQTGDTSVFTEEELAVLRLFGQRDQSGAEALIMAYDCEPGAYRQLFENNIKPHVFVGMHLFQEIWPKKMKEMGGLVEDFDIDALCYSKIPELKKNPHWYDLDKLIKSSDNWSTSERYYYFSKQTCHSGNYGIEWAHFQLNILEKSGGKIFIPNDEAKRFLMVYRGLFPEIPERNRRIARQVEETKVIYNMLGFPYYITNYNILPVTMMEYYAWGPQSTVGEITRIAVTDMQEYIESEKKPWDNLADTHDSWLTQFPLLDVQEYLQKSEEFMNQELISPVDGVRFRMKSEANIGFNWAPYHKDKNPLGLQSPEWLSNN